MTALWRWRVWISCRTRQMTAYQEVEIVVEAATLGEGLTAAKRWAWQNRYIIDPKVPINIARGQPAGRKP